MTSDKTSVEIKIKGTPGISLLLGILSALTILAGAIFLVIGLEDPRAADSFIVDFAGSTALFFGLLLIPLIAILNRLDNISERLRIALRSADVEVKTKSERDIEKRVAEQLAAQEKRGVD